MPKLNKKQIVKLIYFLVGIYIIYYVSSYIKFDFDKIFNQSEISYLAIVAGILMYLFSHTLRVVRLVILNPSAHFSVKNLWREQYKANGVNLLIPFRLGESYRIIYFKQFFGSYYNSFFVLLIERILDFTIIFGLFYLVIYLSDVNNPIFVNVYYAIIFMGILVGIVFFALDELLLIIHRLFLQKETSKLNAYICVYTSKLIRAITRLKKIIHKKWVSCIFMTLLIWGCEVAVFSIFFDVLDGDLSAMILLATLVFLSSLLPSGPAGYGGVQIAFLTVGGIYGISDLINYSIYYNLFIFGSGLIVASIMFIYDAISVQKKERVYD